MSDVYLINGDTLSNIADAIRDKKGTSDAILVENMAEEISGIGGGSSDTIKGLMEGTITELSDNTVIKLRSFALYHHTTLVNVDFPNLTDIGQYAFSGCTNLALTNLPSGVSKINGYAFSDCTNLALTKLPSNVTTISIRAFEKCTGLTTLTFTGTPNTFYANAFDGCTNLTTINVPWAEGAVAYAPWGATNATINYNYTGG